MYFFRAALHRVHRRLQLDTAGTAAHVQLHGETISHYFSAVCTTAVGLNTIADCVSN